MKTHLSPRDPIAAGARIDPFQRIDAPSRTRRKASPPDAASDAPPIRMDVREDANAYRVTAELPGVRTSDILVEIDGSILSISARTRPDPSAAEGVITLCAERCFGRSARTYSLREAVDEAKAEACYEDGILVLVLPKRAAAASTRGVSKNALTGAPPPPPAPELQRQRKG